MALHARPIIFYTIGTIVRLMVQFYRFIIIQIDNFTALNLFPVKHKQPLARKIFALLLSTHCYLLPCILYSQNVTSLVVSPEHPVKHDDTTLRKKLLEWSMYLQVPNLKFVEHASAKYFPGSVQPGYKLTDTTYQFISQPGNSTQYNLSKRFSFAHPRTPAYHSTGLYAVPGQPVYVSLPANVLKKEIYLIIGPYDYLGNCDPMDDWRRMPDVISIIRLDSNFRFATSPFGGLIYLATTDEQPLTTEVKFKNIITAPVFKKSSTTLQQWKTMLENNKAPWGEIASDKVIITLPVATLQTIDDPEKVMTLWDTIISTAANLSQLPYPFLRPIRMVVDEQITAGSMHAGYPIMIGHSPSVGQVSLDVIANPQKLLQPSEGGANWGFFHEIGHDFQNHEWVFDGTGEVSCNLYALYVFDNVVKSRKGAHVNIKQEYQEKLMKDYFAKGASYADYQQDPFLGLIPFMQIQQQFGWEPFKKTFKWYIEHPSDELMANDNDSSYKQVNQLKINRFVERLSIATNRNLAGFFIYWGIPVSESTGEKLKRYKPWLPKELKAMGGTKK